MEEKEEGKGREERGVGRRGKKRDERGGREGSADVKRAGGREEVKVRSEKRREGKRHRKRR